MFFKTRDDLFLFLEHGKYEKYLSEFMEQQKQIKAPSKRRVRAKRKKSSHFKTNGRPSVSLRKK